MWRSWWIVVLLLLGCQPSQPITYVKDKSLPKPRESMAVESIDTPRGPIDPIIPYTGPIDPISQEELPAAVLAGTGGGLSDVVALDPDSPDLFVTTEAGDTRLPYNPGTPKAAETEQGRVDMLIQQGISLLQRSRFDEAITLFREIAAQQPRDARPFMFIGMAHMKSAEQIYALHVQNGDKATAERLSQAEYSRAVASLNMAIKLKEDAANAYMYRANAYLRMGDFSDARDDFSRVIEMEPTASAAFIGRATAYLNLRRFQPAGEDASSAIRLKPDSIDAYVIRFWSRLAVRDLPGAKADYEAAVSNGLGGEAAAQLKQYVEPAVARP